MGIDPIGESELEKLFEVTMGEPRWGIGVLGMATVESATAMEGTSDAEVDKEKGSGEAEEDEEESG